MTQAEEIDMLRRAVADLTERVRMLEARPVVPVYTPLNPVPSLPYPGPTYPYMPWTFIPPVTCSDPMPMRPMTTCVATSTSKAQLWHGEA